MEIILTPGGWGNVELQDICQVLNSVDMAFQPCFGENISRFPVTVIHVQNSDSPYCNRTDRFVYLTTEGTHWCQYAYQFSHEYCHLQIPRKVQSRLRWFEESICELASFYFQSCGKSLRHI